MGYLRILWSRGCKIPNVYTGSVRLTCGYPKVPCGFHEDIRTFRFAGTVRSRVDAVLAWKYPYDQWRKALRGPVRPASARSGYIYKAKHDYVTLDPLGPGKLLTGLLWARKGW